ncbi:MAG: hypothetical protein MK080_07185 [Opitutales bacterium]|nr:hypothetical protein [Opitutales bacterium]NRA28253.1 hypothetical protein [Opitutales bacterium]
MTKAEIAATVDQLSIEERTYMKAYIKMKELVGDPDYRAEMSRRLNAVKAGKGVDQDQVVDLHNRLSKNGL